MVAAWKQLVSMFVVCLIVFGFNYEGKATTLKGVELVSGYYKNTTEIQTNTYVGNTGKPPLNLRAGYMDVDGYLDIFTINSIENTLITQAGGSNMYKYSYVSVISPASYVGFLGADVAGTAGIDSYSNGWYNKTNTYFREGAYTYSLLLSTGHKYDFYAGRAKYVFYNVIEYNNSTSESSFTFKLLCNGNTTVKNIHVTAVNSGYVDGTQKLINNIKPTTGPYNWIWVWDIPVNISCSETFTLTPSIAGPDELVQIPYNSIEAIFSSCSLSITSLTGNSQIINPTSGGNLAIKGDISADQPVNWTLTMPDGAPLGGRSCFIAL
jgi:hypothetical protein